MESREERLDLGWDLLEQGEHQAALDAAESLLAENSKDSEALFLAGSSCLEMGEHPGAERMIRGTLALEPESHPALLTLASLLYETCRFEEAADPAARVLSHDPGSAYAWYLQGLILDMMGRRAEADASFLQAASLEPSNYRIPAALDSDQFGHAVEEALAGLPQEFLDRIASLPILIEDVPSQDLLRTLESPAPDLLGLFVGIPLPEKSHGDLPGPPDTVYLFKRNLERSCEDREDLIEEIRVTLLHEIGHYLGMDEAGYA